MTTPALLLIMAAIGLIRAGWGGRRWLAWAGWAAAALALAILAREDGAWGLAIGTVAGMSAAILLVLWSGWTATAKQRRPPREPPAVTIPRRWSDLVHRVAVFLLVVPIGFAAAQWLTFGAQALARRQGIGASDATALTLLLQPLLWSLLMAWQMTRADARRMVAPPLAAALLGTALWSLA